MKTMFVTNNNGVKKRFQKPNILRKKPKAPPRTNITVNNGLNVPPLVTTTSVPDQIATKEKTLPNHNSLNKSIDNNSIGNEQGNISEIYDESNSNPDTQKSSIFENNLIVDGNSENLSETTINVESFLNNSVSIQNLTDIVVDNEYNSRSKEDWCIDFINNAEEIIIEDIDGSQLGCLRVAANPTVNALPLSAVSPEQGAQNTAAQPVQNLTLEYLPSSTINLQCDVPNCNKKFKSEENLNKHKVIHDKNAKPVLFQCPVKKQLDTSKEEPCGRICNSKDDLIKHLNDEHDPDDAMFICWECERRFFWASGLRAHVRAHGARAAPLACGWPGCDRRFRQPCRLREHMRKHTGDKPYPCHYPNCGWSFRTASKLMRHARVHTGERRHACGQCARAFRRREHLRDHAARAHTQPDTHPTPHACHYEGCEKIFSSAVALKTHFKKIHKISSETNAGYEIEKVAIIDSSVESQEYLTTVLHDTQLNETYVVHVGSATSSTSMESESQAIVGEAESTEEAVNPEVIENLEEIAEAVDMREREEMVELGDECLEVGSWRAARTHCPWPHAEPASPVTHAQVELSEGSESNIYTIRSDLFLHGNVLNNEDSEHMPSAESSLLVVPTESDLGLLDAHPTIDLMQEELMYTDSAVDESSFRVLLLNGEELS